MIGTARRYALMVLLLAVGVMTGQEREWRVVRRHQLTYLPSLKAYLVPNNSWAITRATGHIVTVRTNGTNTVWYDTIPIGGGVPSTASLSTGMDAVARDASIARIPDDPSTLALVVEMDGNVYIARSTDNGEDWSSLFKVNDKYAQGGETLHVTVRHPSLAVQAANLKNRAEVAWADLFSNTGWRTYTRSANLNGAWTESLPPTMNPTTRCAQWGVSGGHADYPSIGGRPKDTYRLVASEFMRGGGSEHREIVFRGSQAGGDTHNYITDNAVPDARPSLAWWDVPESARDTTFVAYQRQMPDGSYEIKLSYAHEDNPGNWSHTTPCSAWQRNAQLKIGDVRHPNLWCSGDTLYMVVVAAHLNDSASKYLYFTSSSGKGDIGRDWRTPSMISGITSDSASIHAHGDTAYVVYNRHHRWGQPESTQTFVVVLRLVETRRLPPGVVDSNAGSRPLAQLPSGSQMFRALATEDIVSAERSTDGGATWYGMLTAGVGGNPSIAVDGDTVPCVVFSRDDTVYCSWWNKDYQDWDKPLVVFAGGTDATPRQAKVALYPGLHDGVKVAAMTLAVYDPINGSSIVLFAKADSGRVLLDTIASNPASLGDSFPSVTVSLDSTVAVVWQSDGRILSRHKSFDPSCWTSHPSDWDTSTTLSAEGARPSSFAENGIVHAVWREEDNSGVSNVHYITAKTCDFTDVTWGGWQSSGTVSPAGSRVKTNPVYAGAGVTSWQEQTGGVWNILAQVRGDTVTLVDTHANSLLPFAVAESSAVTPSVNQVRVKLHWVEELPSDSFEYRFKTCSLNVSAAGSNATGLNNGVKLIRKDGSDSLFAVYADLNGSLMYARSADGSEWTRTSLGSNLVQPTLAADSTGRQWVVSRYTGGLGAPGIRAASRDTAWSGFSEVYPTSQGIAGPASVAGASDDTEPCAWAAFLYNNCAMFGPSHFIIVAKFDGANLFLDTIATGGSGLGNPTIATEPADSGDFVHVCWEDNGEVRYTRTTTAIAADAWGGGLSLNWENPVNLSNSQGTASTHPVVGADRQRVVVAWAEGGTPDILVRARSTDTTYSGFADTVNVSASEAASDHPSIAMGDSVVVVWEERHSQEDSDIRASVEFEAGFTVVDNEGRATYPFAVFQSKASGDSAIPLLHVIHSDAPQENYYEVGYAVRNLKTEGGGGQQSGGRTGPHIRPELAACRPNPFSRLTQIRYQFPREGEVLLRVYDASGRAVRTLAEGRHKPGVYTVTWDGTDARGRTVANGIYFYRLDAPGFRDVKKAVVMK